MEGKGSQIRLTAGEIAQLWIQYYDSKAEAGKISFTFSLKFIISLLLIYY